MSVEHTAARVLTQYLIGTGVVSAPNTNKVWPAFYNRMPENPDNAVAIYDTTGRMDGREMPTKRVASHPGIQVRIRAKSYDVAAEQGFAIVRKLDEILRATVTITETGQPNKQYLLNNVQRTSDLIPIGREESGMRELITVNGVITYSEK